MTDKPKREGPVKVPVPFDEAIKDVLSVKPPAEGWPAYEAKLKQERLRKVKKRKPKPAA